MAGSDDGTIRREVEAAGTLSPAAAAVLRWFVARSVHRHGASRLVHYADLEPDLVVATAATETGTLPADAWYELAANHRDVLFACPAFEILDRPMPGGGALRGPAAPGPSGTGFDGDALRDHTNARGGLPSRLHLFVIADGGARRTLDRVLLGRCDESVRLAVAEATDPHGVLGSGAGGDDASA